MRFNSTNILLEQPIRVQECYNAPTQRQDIVEWLLDFVMPVVGSFGHRTPETLKDTVDDDDREENHGICSRKTSPIYL